MRLGIAFNCFGTLSFRGRKDLVRGELPAWLSVTKILQIAVVSPRDRESKPPLQTSGSDHVCRAEHCICITHLSHLPPEEETTQGRDAIWSLLLPQRQARACTHGPKKVSGARTVAGEPWLRLQLLKPWMETGI